MFWLAVVTLERLLTVGSLNLGTLINIKNIIE
jgi:hypothetical protein